MKAAESRFFGRKRHGHAGNSAAAHIALRADLPGFICRLLAHLRPVLRVMTLAVVMAGLASAPLPGEFASAAAYGGAHAALAEQQATDHGHSHEDEPHGHALGHSHGHDPADHSHQYAFLSGDGSHWRLPPSQRWNAGLISQPDAAMALGIERPPKQALPL